MARASVEVIMILKRTARNLERSNHYQWGHMGACNCGFLAQEITHLSKGEIHQRAMQGYGDWNEQLNDYCPTSGLPIDNLISELIDFGFDADDLKQLEKLSNPEILQAIPFEKRNLRHNQKSDVILYLDTWSNLLENKLLNTIQLPSLEENFSAEVERVL